MTELLGSAEEAFLSANAAHEKGDNETALRHYARMLELLMEAEIDPAVFYDLRTEFEQILERTSKQTTRFEPKPKPAPVPEWTQKPRIERHVAGDLPIPFPLPERVVKEIERIENNYPKHFQAGLNRSYKYAPYIRRELAAAGLPQDLVWLAMVESQFYPRAISPAGACGMWQFMRGTAHRFELQTDRADYYIDERFNWEKSTKAAIAYLKELYVLFDGNWPLAVSAYNMGERGLEQAVALNGGERNFWKLIETPPASYHIRRETKRFYPKLLATILIAQNPERYGITITPQSPDEVVWIPVKGHYSLDALAKATGLPRDTLQQLNPELVRGETSPNGEHLLAVPADAQSRFMVALGNVPQLRHAVYASSTAGTTLHTVRQGETLSEIGMRYRVSVRDLMAVNKIRSPKRLQVGKKLIVPIRGGYREYGSSSGGRTYTVRRGDTMSEIAKRQRVTVAELQQWNKKGKSTRIHAGELLLLSAPGSAPAPIPSGEKRIHVVQANEYPAKIAKLYGVPLDDFLRWNNLTTRSLIRVGDKLIVYGSGAEPSQTASREPSSTNVSTSTESTETKKDPVASAPQPPETEKVVHRVAPGENPWVIAKKYGVGHQDFLAWNALSTKSVLQIGDQCVVYRQNGSSVEDQPAETEQPQGEKILHTVTRGQNPSTIAKRYRVKLSDLFKWNGWEKTPVLQIGSTVVIYKQ